ncbi:hypothetical protein DesfrDRAFT_2421 [Solidesulfovibrio fructosivorans JJ]]|uniref:Uncharacterized protein n=1 Tax=Solidesulfovibrio fructosivorans JJ] TaxID=596151 RepID=E1JXS2_SOLFR|nr:hypothetical protein [Solidesulfovibrio fructosivorans]EFL50845.1 hypothetical protein DesfrDRAFT_2421 [Solidesulfovibrio fructosivorans JJ]]
MRWRTHFSASASWLLALAALIGFGVATGHPLHDSYCALTLPVVDPVPRHTRLLGCSNMEQRPEWGDAADIATDTPGWRMYTPKPGQEEARIVVRLRKYSDRVVFYPRLSGAAASVTVNELLGPFSKKLFSLSGRDGRWTQVGAQYPLCLGCVENGWSDEEFPITLEIVLKGQGSQLWHKGKIVFFEAP